MSAAQFESLIRYIDTVPLTQSERKRLGEHILGTSTRKTIRKRSSKSTPDMDTLMQISEMVLPADLTMDEIVAECKAARKELYDRQQILELGHIEGCRIMTLRQFIMDIQAKK